MSSILRTAALLLAVQALSVLSAQTSLVRNAKDQTGMRKEIQMLLQNAEEVARSGATPAFDKVNEIKRIVNEELITDLQATHAAAVTTVASNLESIKLCNTQGTTRMSDIRTNTETSVASARTAHESCREEEKAKHSTRGTRCGELDTFLDTINDPANLPTERPRAGMVQFVQTMSNYYCPKGPEVTTLNTACDEAEAERAKHEAECDRKQSTFESGYCTWRTELVDNCGTLGSCYSKAQKEYKDHVTTTTELVTKWKLEWAALQKILCYTDVWLKDSDVSTADAGTYAECNAKTPDTSSMDIDFGTPEPEVACPLTSVANYPGSSGFVGQEYSDIGEFAKSPISCISSGNTRMDSVPMDSAPAPSAPTLAPAPTLPPSTAAPTTEAPTTEAPTTAAPTTEAPTTAAPLEGMLLATHGGWSFYKVETADTSDDGITAACKGAGMVVPCTGGSGCRYNDDKCTMTSEVGCGNPMITTAKKIAGCSMPRTCDAFTHRPSHGKGTYAYMGYKWAGRNTGCGAKHGNWCTQGSSSIDGYAFCAKAESGEELVETAAKTQVRRHESTKEIVDVEADGSIHSLFATKGAKCSSLYTADMCPSGKLADNQDDIDCGEDPCVDDAADDGLCCKPVEDDEDEGSLAATASKTYKHSDLEHMEVSDLMSLVKSLGGAADAKAALAKLQSSL